MASDIEKRMRILSTFQGAYTDATEKGRKPVENNPKALKARYGEMEADYATYQNELRSIQRYNPEIFAEFQERNTNEKLHLLNTLDFDMDNYSLDPVSREGLSRLPFALNVPYGFSQTDLGGGRLAETFSPDSLPRKGDRVSATGAFTYQDEVGSGNTNAKQMLRHEAQHLVPGFDSERAAYTLDGLYRDFNGKERRPDSKGQLQPSANFLDRIARYGRDNPNLKGVDRPDIPEPKSFKNIERYGMNDLKALKGADRIKFLNSIDSYDSPWWGTNTSRDLPNVGWFDKLSNSIKGF